MLPTESLAALVAIARAAWLARDRHLQRAATNELRERYGIDLRFRRAGKAVARA